MTQQEILKFGEIQYLMGRLDELNKALPTITNLERKRNLDQRIEKYLNKLKRVDEVTFNLYQVMLINRHKSKEKSKKEIKYLLEEIIKDENTFSEEVLLRIKNKINSL